MVVVQKKGGILLPQKIVEEITEATEGEEYVQKLLLCGPIFFPNQFDFFSKIGSFLLVSSELKSANISLPNCSGMLIFSKQVFFCYTLSEYLINSHNCTCLVFVMSHFGILLSPTDICTVCKNMGLITSRSSGNEPVLLPRKDGWTCKLDKLIISFNHKLLREEQRPDTRE